MCAAFLCAVAGISPPTIGNSASYVSGWLKRIKSDKKLLVQAAGQAQRAANLILGVSFDDAKKPSPPASSPAAVAERRPLAGNHQLRLELDYAE